MGFFSGLINVNDIKNDSALPPLSNDAAWTNYLRGLGYGVSHDTALKIAVVIRCADVVAKTMAALGCHVYRDTDAGKERAKNIPVYNMLRFQPNRETTAYEFWHMYIFNLMLTKGAFAKIVRDRSGFVKEIWNIPSNRVTFGRNPVTKERFIDVSYSSLSHETVTGERIYDGNFMYTPGLRFSDEDQTHDFIQIAAEVLGLTKDLNSYAKDYFENGSNMGGFITYPNGINEVAFNKFKADWGKTYAGVMNQHKWALLEGGFEVQKMDSNPEQAQALESRKFQVIEVCRIMGVTPHKVFALEGVNYNSIEQLNIEFWQETVDPMDERVCQTIYKDVLTAREKAQNHFARFNTLKLLKGDTATRTTYYNSMRNNGVMNANEIRDLEEMNRIPKDQGGDEYLINGNMISLMSAKNNLPKSLQKGGAVPNAK